MDSKLILIQFHAVVAVVLVLATELLQVRAQGVSLDAAKAAAHQHRRRAIRFVQHRNGGGNRREVLEAVPQQELGNSTATEPAQSTSMPAGMDPNTYQYRPPIDLSNPRLRKLASALGPAYVRVSGTWANSVYFTNSDNSQEKAPAGFSGVLTRKKWKGVIDFI